MIAWLIIGILGVLALWALAAVAESILRLILAVVKKPGD